MCLIQTLVNAGFDEIVHGSIWRQAGVITALNAFIALILTIVIMARKVRALSHSSLSKHVHSSFAAYSVKEASGCTLHWPEASGNMGGNSNTINSQGDLG